MCKSCRERWDALPQRERDGCDEFVRTVQSSVVRPLAEAGIDPIVILAACAFTAEYHRRQMDEHLLGIVDEQVARLMAGFEARLAAKGQRLEPQPHTPMQIEPAAQPASSPPPGDSKELDLSNVPEGAREALAELIGNAEAAGLRVSVVAGTTSYGPRPTREASPPERPAFVRRAPRRGRPS